MLPPSMEQADQLQQTLAQPGIKYGTDATQNEVSLIPSNAYPLFAAWLLLTTNPPAGTIDADTISAAARMDPASVEILLQAFRANQVAFSTVGSAFGTIAASFASVGSQYS